MCVRYSRRREKRVVENRRSKIQPASPSLWIDAKSRWKKVLHVLCDSCAVFFCGLEEIFSYFLLRFVANSKSDRGAGPPGDGRGGKVLSYTERDKA